MYPILRGIPSNAVVLTRKSIRSRSLHKHYQTREWAVYNINPSFAVSAQLMTSPSSETDGDSAHSKRQGGDAEESESLSKRLKKEDSAVAGVIREIVDNKSVSDAEQSELNGVELEFEVEGVSAEDKGARHAMEDASVVLQDAFLDHPGKLRCMHYAVYDGHGGRLAADYAQRHLHSNVVSAGLPRELMDVKTAKKAILEGFRRTDEELLTASAAGGWLDGATAVCVWVLGKTVFVANIGDAKAVLARSSVSDGLQNLNETNPFKAIVLTREHKAIYPQERARIQKAGGSVGSNGRLQGRLEVSRAFGDRQFKKVGVVATPDIHSFDVTIRDQFIILGCDGLWGVFGPIDAVNFVQKLLKEGLPTAAISRHLVREAVRERRCKDNCTAIVIVFRHK